MRQIFVQVPRGEGEQVLRSAEDCRGTNLSMTQASGSGGGPLDLVVVYVPNNNVGPFLSAIESIDDMHASVVPSGVLTLKPPASQVAQQAVDVTARSPMEILIAGLQSIGSWQGFLGYATAAGVVVWLGLLLNSSFLLVAAMLIAPFAGPAMNTAIATARGDLSLLWHTILRYVAALSVTIVTAGLLSVIFGQSAVTQSMASTANISATSVLLPLASGAAGALSLSQSQRSSLVSGAAIGILVAAALAPPAALIGMATVMGRWKLVLSGGFLLGLQLVGINLSGAIVFRLFGLSPSGPRYSRGRRWVVWLALAGTIAGLGGLMLLQFGTTSPTLQRTTVEQRVRSTVLDLMKQDGTVEAASTTVQFTRANIQSQNTLLIQIYAQRKPGTTASNQALKDRITNEVQRTVNAHEKDVTPLVDVTILSPPSQGP